MAWTVFIKEGFGLSFEGLVGFGAEQKRGEGIPAAWKAKASSEAEMPCKCHSMP